MHDFVRGIQKRSRIAILGLCIFPQKRGTSEANDDQTNVRSKSLLANGGVEVLTELSKTSENDVCEREARMWFGVAKFSPKRTNRSKEVKRMIGKLVAQNSWGVWWRPTSSYFSQF